MHKYKEHGSFNIEFKNKTLIIDATGPFNLELVTRYHNDIFNSAELQALEGLLWSQIVILHEESLFTPEAAQKLMELNRLKKQKGLKRSAVVLVNPVGSALIAKQLNYIYSEAGIEIKIFADIGAANNWLSLFN